ncbi:MAG: hypothetical protein EOO16_15395 [Chitinophagaceae bacterium]|nr:MAG: hypothetical protein EOO16_15395 [Chitinophagaceae bacterium]
MRRIPVLALFALLLMAFRCRQDYPCAEDSYSFGVSGSFAPASARVAVGDTVFFESVFPKSLYDSVSGRTINYAGSRGIEGGVYIYQIDTVRHQFVRDSVSARFFVLQGTAGEGGSTSQRFGFREDGSGYQARVGTIIQKPGIYVVFANGFDSLGLQGQECGGASFRVRIPLPAASTALFQQAMGRPPGMGEDELYTFRVQ